MEKVLSQEQQWKLRQHIEDSVSNTLMIARDYLLRPSVLYRPELTLEDGTWCAKYGDCVGKGNTPQDAMYDFNHKWAKPQSTT